MILWQLHHHVSCLYKWTWMLCHPVSLFSTQYPLSCCEECEISAGLEFSISLRIFRTNRNLDIRLCENLIISFRKKKWTFRVFHQLTRGPQDWDAKTQLQIWWVVAFLEQLQTPTRILWDMNFVKIIWGSIQKISLWTSASGSMIKKWGVDGLKGILLLVGNKLIIKKGWSSQELFNWWCEV